HRPPPLFALVAGARRCVKETVDVVLVAGDVFDTYLPSAEAEEVFFRAVKKIAGGKRAVVIISGNHDDSVRLAASAPIAAEEGIYIFGNKATVFPVGGDCLVHVAASGENYLVLENGAGEKVYINALPYPNEARLREDKTDESFGEKMQRWIEKGNAGYDGSMPYILLSHLFVAGGSTSEGERNIDLGGARAVPVSCLPSYGYTALGHLHKKQRIGANGRYSGSLLQYSFDETNSEKSVVLLKTELSDISVVKEIPLTSGKKLVRLEACGVEDARSLLANYKDCFVELTLHLNAPLTSAETQSLKEANHGLVSLIPRVSSLDGETIAVRSNMTAEELFHEYYFTQFGEEAPRELVEAFLALLSEEV
ncbi:MAG: exonuclease subunit SbcD, partial [Clostridia bacterium]|nr:exonuclease subunit SbcD [Clostridia bacterium]